MKEKFYTASLSRSQDRSGWSIIFRHPARYDDATGKTGVRVRRGLGTRNVEEAERMKEELNVLLSEPRYWEPTARDDAEKRFDPIVVDIFYHKLVPEKIDFSGSRDEFILLPDSATSDYRRVLFIGTTGAGKTTLVRQLIGTKPEIERFPSTSTAKTTVHDIEIVLTDGLYKAVVTFASSDEVREHLNECLSNAILAAYRGAEDTQIMRRLLNHVNQRFRFNYILGNGPVSNSAFTDDEDIEDEFLQESLTGEDFGNIDIDHTNQTLTAALAKIKDLADSHGVTLRSELEATSETDERVIDEIFEEELDCFIREDERFHEIADTLMDEIEDRFDLLNIGSIHRTRQGWPLSWYWETDDRQSFIKEILRFSSNYAPLFGRLLTPLVNGVRVAGPFAPTWENEVQPKLVLLDGEGLGHTPGSFSAISTLLSEKINYADAVVLVDSATQPMQASPVAAMRELVSSGNSSKLLICFTHFDEVRGDNIPSYSAKVQHVLASAENVLTSLGEDLGPFAERALRQRIEQSCFFLADTDKTFDPERKAHEKTIKELHKLLDTIDKVNERPEEVATKPVYDKMNLVLAVKIAAERFQEDWRSRLGIEIRHGVPKEHWTRIKALSRRLATPDWTDEYDTLKPVADLRKDLQDRIYVFLQNPVKWDELEPTEEQKQQIYDSLAENISRRMQGLSSRRIRVERIKEWQDAFNKQGRGSTYVRAAIISDQVYEQAAPIPDMTPSPDRNQFLREVAEEIENAVNDEGAKLI
ncbi:MAG: hypothetical protein BWX80_01002 [Candidatus Hydrogenedentes bacterium ADurb.Bin101]|nr:MAG: hypothetical protein BWX80_01002 [Candidatus Hydrogenedentes bacterium ADurb.Bin101]